MRNTHPFIDPLCAGSLVVRWRTGHSGLNDDQCGFNEIILRSMCLAPMDYKEFPQELVAQTYLYNLIQLGHRFPAMAGH